MPNAKLSANSSLSTLVQRATVTILIVVVQVPTSRENDLSEAIGGDYI